MNIPETLVILTNPQREKTQQRTWPIWVMFLISLALTLGKLPNLPTADAFTHLFSLADLPKHLHRHVEYLLLVPLSGIVVSFFRLTLGISVFSFFRPILIAIAFRATGVEIGLALLIAALAVIALVRPLLRSADYYARLPILMSLLVSLMAVALMCGKFWHLAWMQQLAYFPVIALCLTCDSFSKLLEQRGSVEAIWRAATTTFVGLVIAGVASIPGLMPTMLRFPECLIAQAGCILFINKFLSPRLFEGRNPLRMALGRSPGRQTTPSLDSQTSREFANISTLKEIVS